jgi:CheY-like chemotaxis protein
MSAPDILYIEDNADFVDVVERAMVQIDNQTTIKTIDDGIVALQQLQSFADNKVRPKLILIDMNLPGLSGLDILKRIKELQALRYVPTVIFSTSDNPRDVKSSMEFGANAYVTKPLGYLNLVKCLSSLHEFWLKTACLQVN